VFYLKLLKWGGRGGLCNTPFRFQSRSLLFKTQIKTICFNLRMKRCLSCSYRTPLDPKKESCSFSSEFSKADSFMKTINIFVFYQTINIFCIYQTIQLLCILFEVLFLITEIVFLVFGIFLSIRNFNYVFIFC
jgi:hypothetical protein